jgi:hypothetical protein
MVRGNLRSGGSLVASLSRDALPYLRGLPCRPRCGKPVTAPLGSGVTGADR